MSFGWSVGDLIKGACLIKDAYQCLADGPRNARGEALNFKRDFNLILESLTTLGEENPEGLDLGPAYQDTLDRCGCFIQHHVNLAGYKTIESLGKVRTWHRVFVTNAVTLYQKITWPAQRAEAQRLRDSLQRYVKIAVLKRTRTITMQNRQMLEATESAKLEQRQPLQATKFVKLFLPHWE